MRVFFVNKYTWLIWTLLMALPSFSQQTTPRYKVAACDWMMLKRQKLGEFQLAHQIGADGVEVDMGGLGNRTLFDNQLRRPEQAEKFKVAAIRYGIEVPSMAMSGFFAQSFIKRNNYKDLLNDCFQTMKVFGSKVAFLPLGGSGNTWHEDGADRDTLIARLRVAGEMAKKEGVVIGIRTAMDTRWNIRLLRAIGSKNIQIYYNLQDAADNHRDICKELKLLGRHRIIQIHASNTDSVNLCEDPDIDLPKIKKTLDKMGWGGWLVVERSRDVRQVRNVKYNFGRNVAYLKEVFQGKKPMADNK